jgi:hypothetical protein
MKWVVNGDDVYVIFFPSDRAVLIEMLKVVKSSDPKEQIALDRLMTHIGGTPDPTFPGYENMTQ